MRKHFVFFSGIHLLLQSILKIEEYLWKSGKSCNIYRSFGILYSTRKCISFYLKGKKEGECRFCLVLFPPEVSPLQVPKQ